VTVHRTGFWRILTVLSTVGLAFLACSQTRPRAPEAFPETDIVFQVSTLWDEWNSDKDSLGFINADGTGLTYVNGWRAYSPPVLPVVTNDGSMVAFRIEGNPYMPGDLVIWQVGQPARGCNVDPGSYRPALTVGTTRAVIDLASPRGRLMILDLAECFDNDAPLTGSILTLSAPDTQIHGALSPDGEMLAYAERDPDLGSRVVIVRRMSDGAETTLGQGIMPAWSPDGQWIAYTRLDGIYKADSKGEDIHRILDYTSPDSSGRPLYPDWWPPLPSWSPDGKWLVYHKCILPPAPKTHCGEEIEDYAIFKVNVETGEEIKILDGGLNPYWRWKPRSE